jgi:signal transduction histidine kinase/ligand-binding sensor domain-containing protein
MPVKNQHMQKVLIILLSFLTITSFTASAQYYNFQNYTVEDGLPQSQVFALFQDERSNLWLGTNGGGMARFNGREFEVFRRKDGLMSDLILEINENKKGDLIIKTNLGFSVFDGREFRNYPFTGGDLLNSDRMLMDKNGDVWFRLRQDDNEAEVYKFDGDTYHVMSNVFKELEEHTWLNGMTTDPDRNILISSGNNTYTISGEKIELHALNSFPELQDKRIVFLYKLIDNRLFLAALSGNREGGTYIYNESEGLERMQIPEEMGDNFNFFTEDRSGNIWLRNGLRNILYRWNHSSGTNKIDHFTEDSGLPIEGLRSLIQDMEGNIWIGTDGSGLFKYGGAKFISFLSSQGLDDYFVWSIQQDSKGNYWFGTANNGIFKYEGDKLTGYHHLEKEPLGIIREILEYRGSYLVGSRNGLWTFDEKSIAKVNSDFGIHEFSIVNDILPGEDESIWIATANFGVYFYDGKKTINYNTDNSGIGSNSIDDILLDRSGVFWFATRGGLSRLKDGEIKNFINNEYGLYAIMQITEDNFGNIWAATYGGGVCQARVDENDRFFVKKFDTDAGLSSDNVYSIITDNDGFIWAGCQQGVDKITLDPDGNLEHIRNYDNYEGFTGFENNGKANFIDKDGQIWFGTIKGAMVYNPEMDIMNITPPKTNITGLKLFYKNVDWSSDEMSNRYEQLTAWTDLPEQLVLPYNKNHLTFEFEGLSYTVPEKVQFQWKLKGVDTDWSPVSNRMDAVYANLSPGDYTFLVLSGNNDNIWGDQPAAFSFAIKPPFWATWWFRSMVLLFIITVVLIISWLRNKFIREKRQELEQLVAYKTKKLEQQKNEILNQNIELEKQYENLDMLSKIGRDITANITVESLQESVYKKLNSLMDASIMGFGIYRKDQRIIEFPKIITSQKHVDKVKISYDEKFCMAVECLKENKEIIVNNFEEEFADKPEYWNPPLKGKESASIVFIPLIYNDHPLGVLTVQSPSPNAYNEYHLNILRNMAIYAKIALENVSAYEKIQEHRNELSKANRDIVRQKGEIEENNRKLIELNNEKTNIIGIVAHDLKNPLTSAFTMASILKSESDNLETDQKQCIEVIEKSINRMNDMINRLLDIRKIEDKISKLRLEKVNLHQIIREVNNNLSNEINRKGINLSVQAEELYAKVDPDYAIQVFENLISNAIKFSPPDKAVKVILAKGNGKARTEIIDEGPGLTDEDKKKVFGKFQRLSAKPTGGEQSTGLGLSIVKKYVEAMDGKVWCESEQGKGANFIVEFNRID